MALEHVARGTAVVGKVADAFGYDVGGASFGFLDAHLLEDSGRDVGGEGVSALVGENGIGNRLQPFLAGGLCAGAATWLVGGEDVLYLRRLESVVDGLPHLVGERPCRLDGGYDVLLARYYLVVFLGEVLDVEDGDFIEPSRHLFAITAYERNGGAGIEQVDGRLYHIDGYG